MTAHLSQETLIDLAYGELRERDAAVAQSHVDGCADCARALGGIKGVRRVMAALPQEEAPEAGRDSLVAYATQAARRRGAGEGRGDSTRFGRIFAALAGLTAIAVVGVIAQQVPGPSLSSRAVADVRPSPPASVPSAGAAPAAQAPAESPGRDDRLAEASPAPASELARNLVKESQDEGSAVAEKARPERRKMLDEAFGMGDARPSATGSLGGAAGGLRAGAKQEAKPEKKVAQRDAFEPSEPRSSPPPSPATVAAAPAPAVAGSASSSVDALGARASNEAPRDLTPSVPVQRPRLVARAQKADKDAESEEAQSKGKLEQTEVVPPKVAALRAKLARLTGAEREPVLDALCDAEMEAELWMRAEQTCALLLREFPASGSAVSARRRMVGAQAQQQLLEAQ